MSNFSSAIMISVRLRGAIALRDLDNPNNENMRPLAAAMGDSSSSLSLESP